MLQRVLAPHALVVEAAQRRTRLAVALQARSPRTLTAARLLRAASRISSSCTLSRKTQLRNQVETCIAWSTGMQASTAEDSEANLRQGAERLQALRDSGCKAALAAQRREEQPVLRSMCLQQTQMHSPFTTTQTEYTGHQDARGAPLSTCQEKAQACGSREVATYCGVESSFRYRQGRGNT